jgi:hypothetical protein
MVAASVSRVPAGTIPVFLEGRKVMTGMEEKYKTPKQAWKYEETAAF